jgi:hypothetical protein
MLRGQAASSSQDGFSGVQLLWRGLDTRSVERQMPLQSSTHVVLFNGNRCSDKPELEILNSRGCVRRGTALYASFVNYFIDSAGHSRGIFTSTGRAVKYC